MFWIFGHVIYYIHITHTYIQYKIYIKKPKTPDFPLSRKKDRADSDCTDATVDGGCKSKRPGGQTDAGVVGR